MSQVVARHGLIRLDRIEEVQATSECMEVK